ncbi:winged helix-turn-helix transcriptional regulator [Methanosphaerula palustris]|uniref:Transcriptional regulator, HxlR family n=1 Tax=Methanosphaerula palustris (strain ATCC BAA-1556 / DSM 19958 / E1-9c) TaxID=521011 RepID=B8GG12_METPE|nr:helix-turn-helix domain-containing protein [Methanosphaerula palustris]ACL16086.1 transcriptional regulator, HxlR family [Methanosphaerula palustris E1-9c]
MHPGIQTADTRKPLTPAVPYRNCPILISVGILGKKWTLLILRDIGLLKINRFNQILRSLPGLTPRVLTLRLHELEAEGLIRAVMIHDTARIVEWELTDKGMDTIPILMSFIAFSARWYPDEVFMDQRARDLDEIYPQIHSLKDLG